MMLILFGFGWSSWCCQHARRAHCVGQLLSKSVRVCKLIHSTPSGSEASVTGQTACVFLVRASECEVTNFLFMMRFVFSPVWETVRKTQSYDEQASRFLKRNSSKRLAEISGLRTSATSKVVLMLLPALVLTRKSRCPWCLMCDPFAPLKKN